MLRSLTRILIVCVSAALSCFLLPALLVFSIALVDGFAVNLASYYDVSFMPFLVGSFKEGFTGNVVIFMLMMYFLSEDPNWHHFVSFPKIVGTAFLHGLLLYMIVAPKVNHQVFELVTQSGAYLMASMLNSLAVIWVFGKLLNLLYMYQHGPNMVTGAESYGSGTKLRLIQGKRK